MSILALLFPKFLIRIKGLLKRLNGLASEYHSGINVLTGSKDSSNQHDTTINLLSLEYKENLVGESLL